MTTSKRTVSQLVLGFVFFLLFFAGGYPGAINPDTAAIFHQARSLEVTDWHSPAAVLAISFLIPISRTPQNVLFFQSLFCAAFFVAVIAEVLRADDAGARSRWIIRPIIAVLLSVLGLSLFAIQCVVLKDTWITIAYIGLVAALLRARGTRPSLTLSLVLILIPSLIRPTSFIGAIPFAFYLLRRSFADGAPILPHWFQLKTRKAMFATIVVASIVCVLTVPLVTVINRTIIGAVSTHPEFSTQLFDLAGISAMRGVDQFAAEGLIPAGTPKTSVLSCYEPSSSNRYIWGDCKWVIAALTERGLAGSPKMYMAWIHAIVTHPIAYAKHRIGYMKLLLAPKSAAEFFDYVGATNTPQGVTSLPADWRNENDFWTPRLPIVTTLRVLKPFLSIGFGSPIIWILADIICIGVIVTLRIRNSGDAAGAIDDVIIASALSSLLSLVTFAVLAPSYTARYLFWTYISTLVAVLLFVARSRSLTWLELVPVI